MSEQGDIYNQKIQFRSYFNLIQRKNVHIMYLLR